MVIQIHAKRGQVWGEKQRMFIVYVVLCVYCVHVTIYYTSSIWDDRRCGRNRRSPLITQEFVSCCCDVGEQMSGSKQIYCWHAHNGHLTIFIDIQILDKHVTSLLPVRRFDFVRSASSYHVLKIKYYATVCGVIVCCTKKII